MEQNALQYVSLEKTVMLKAAVFIKDNAFIVQMESYLNSDAVIEDVEVQI